MCGDNMLTILKTRFNEGERERRLEEASEELANTMAALSDDEEDDEDNNDDHGKSYPTSLIHVKNFNISFKKGVNFFTGSKQTDDDGQRQQSQ